MTESYGNAGTLRSERIGLNSIGLLFFDGYLLHDEAVLIV